MNQIEFSPNDAVLPDKSNEIKFSGTLEELKKYLPELYEQITISEKNNESI